MSRRDRDEWGDGPDEEPTPVEWSVWGDVDGVYTHHYIKALEATDAEDKFKERYWDKSVENVEATISEYQ